MLRAKPGIAVSSRDDLHIARSNDNQAITYSSRPIFHEQWLRRINTTNRNHRSHCVLWQNREWFGSTRIKWSNEFHFLATVSTCSLSLFFYSPYGTISRSIQTILKQLSSAAAKKPHTHKYCPFIHHCTRGSLCASLATDVPMKSLINSFTICRTVIRSKMS